VLKNSAYKKGMSTSHKEAQKSQNEIVSLAVRGLLQGCDFCAFLWRVLVFVGGDTFGEGVAVDAEDGGRVREMLFVTREGLLNIELLKLAERFIQKDVALEHLLDQAFKSGVNQSSFPVNNRYASR